MKSIFCSTFKYYTIVLGVVKKETFTHTCTSECKHIVPFLFINSFVLATAACVVIDKLAHQPIVPVVIGPRFECVQANKHICF